MAHGSSTPIGQHGVIGDMETLALVGRAASIEWCCWPRFDSPSIFGCLLDEDGGAWSITPVGESWRDRQMYLPDTNVLVTRFHSDEGLVEVEDFMVVGGAGRGLVRRVTGVRGAIEMRSVMAPRPDYGRREPTLTAASNGSVLLDVGGTMLSATGTVDLTIADDARSVTAAFVVSEGETHCFALGTDGVDLLDDELRRATSSFWRSWISQSSYRGAYAEVVRRSALTLKLLTHQASGGVIAAGTTSLPELVGGERNWDYRYVWIRDAAFTLYAFLELGFTAEAEAFTGWLGDRLIDDDRNERASPLAPLYDLDGSTKLDEIELDHWSGHRDSRPVRVGNAASRQLQLDTYGELLDCMYLADKRGAGLSLATWRELAALVDWVCDHWDQPDDGMWEVRSGRQRFTSSALMCWVAVERGIRMANFRGRPADLDRWRRTRDEIHAAIVERGWSEDRAAFTQVFDGDQLDASLLLMPLVKFVSGTDPQWLSTLAAIEDGLVHGVLVDRYDNATSDDGLEGDDGSFSICSFWLVECLARAGRLEDARIHFEKMLTFAGPLGLFSEVVSPSGDQLGNYPQAFTHLSLISAAIHLDRLSTPS
ncbi:MAG: glycoside hydrolase family 15 protein [Acidimicrobiales bacterium]